MPSEKPAEEPSSHLRLPDEALALEARHGSERAFRELVLRWQRPVYSLIVRRVRDRAEAEDLTQETFLKAHRALSRYDPERRFSSWLLRIAHNAAIDALRKRHLPTVPLERPAEEEGRHEIEIADESRPSPEERAVGRQLGNAFRAAVAELRAEHREALLLRFEEQLSYEEIAELLDLPLGTVKTFIFRARQELAKRLARQGYRVPGRPAGGAE